MSEPTITKRKILIVEDDKVSQQLYVYLLNKDADLFEITLANSVSEAFKYLEEYLYEAIILDYSLPDGIGLEIIKHAVDTPTILITTHDNSSLAVEAIKMGAYEFLVKDEKNLHLSLLPAIVEKVINQHKSRIQLQESEERYRDLFDNSNDLIQCIASDGSFIYVNESWRRSLKYTVEEVKSLNFLDAIHPDYKEHCSWVFEQLSAGKEVETFEVIFLTKDGQALVMEGNVTPKVVNGKLISTRGIFKNITAQKSVLERLTKSEASYKLLVEHTDVAIYQINTKGRFTFINDVGIQRSGYTKDEFSQLHFTDLIHKDFKSKVSAFYSEQLTEKMANSFIEFLLVTKNGSEVWVGQSTTAIFDTNKRVIGYTAVVRDISKRKKAEIELLKLKQDLQVANETLNQTNENLEEIVAEKTEYLKKANLDLWEVNKDLDDFVYRASHDLRGPISTILGLAHVAKMEVLGKDSLPYLEQFESTALQMDRLLRKLIVISTIKKNTPKHVLVETDPMLENLEEYFIRYIPEKLEKAIITKKVDPTFISDPFLVFELLKELLENALLFTNPHDLVTPLIQIEIRTIESEISISVTDNGVGIDKRYHKQVFDLFFKGNDQSSGRGIGLYLVRSGVNKLGGSVKVNSKLGEFTKVEISFPLSKITDSETSILAESSHHLS